MGKLLSFAKKLLPAARRSTLVSGARRAGRAIDRYVGSQTPGYAMMNRDAKIKAYKSLGRNYYKTGSKYAKRGYRTYRGIRSDFRSARGYYSKAKKLTKYGARYAPYLEAASAFF